MASTQPTQGPTYNLEPIRAEPPSPEQKQLSSIAVKAAQLGQTLKDFLKTTKTETLKTVPLTLLLQTKDELGELAEQVAKIGYQIALAEMKLEDEASEDVSPTSSFDAYQAQG